MQRAELEKTEAHRTALLAQMDQLEAAQTMQSQEVSFISIF
jgi:hypothetical protein